jgi:hypothetical protein
MKKKLFNPFFSPFRQDPKTHEDNSNNKNMSHLSFSHTSPLSSNKHHIPHPIPLHDLKT